MKKVLIGFGLILVLVIGSVVVLYSNLGEIIKEAIQRFGSEATQATVVVDAVDLDVATGSTGLKGFVVGNPAGFKTESAFELGDIAVQVDTKSLNSDTIIINTVNIVGPRVTYEVGDVGSNVDAIKRNVETYARKFSNGETATESSGDSGAQKKIIIERLTISEGNINVSAPFLDGKKVGSDLPMITLTDIGKDSGGANPAEVIKTVINAMTAGVGKAIAGLDLDAMSEQARAKAKEALDKATSSASDAVNSATEGSGSAGEDAGKAIKGLLGN